jgi:hypothetical protein
MRTLIAVALCALVFPAYAACEERGGPGFRDQNGHCVGWAQLGRVCGSPPTTRCTVELKGDGADEAADFGVKAIEAKNKHKKARDTSADTGQSD